MAGKRKREKNRKTQHQHLQRLPHCKTRTKTFADKRKRKKKKKKKKRNFRSHFFFPHFKDSKRRKHHAGPASRREGRGPHQGPRRGRHRPPHRLRRRTLRGQAQGRRGRAQDAGKTRRRCVRRQGERHGPGSPEPVGPRLGQAGDERGAAAAGMCATERARAWRNCWRGERTIFSFARCSMGPIDGGFLRASIASAMHFFRRFFLLSFAAASSFSLVLFCLA